MDNPWLNISASVYEGHMGSPNVDQLSFLAVAFREALEDHNCTSVALLGCATGNGLEFVNYEETERLTAVDINPEYLAILRQRYRDSVPGLEIIQYDLETCRLDEQAYSLIFAGLVFEYLEPRALLQRISRWLSEDGIMVAVLQLPAKKLPGVTETPYQSLKALNSIMNLIDPEQFKVISTEIGLIEIEGKEITLATGKSFYIGTFRKKIVQIK